jgi:hypothetical protein
MQGVSIEFFTASVKTLTRMYPNKMCGKSLEAMREGLALAEAAFQALPDTPKRPKSKPKKQTT